MQYSSIQKNVSTSPRKLRLVADMIRKMSPDQAVEMLSFTNKAAALPLSKAIKTAIANSGKKEGLFFEKIEINEGMKLRRNRVGTAGRGRSRPYRRRWSHIKIVLTDDLKIEAQSSKRKDAENVKQVQEKADEKLAESLKRGERKEGMPG